MRQPEIRKPPAGTGGISEGDQLAGRIESDSIADLVAVADAAWETITALFLSSPPLDWARETLEQLPAVVPDPLFEWWLAGVRLCVEALRVPNPITVADAAIRADLEPPPAFRGHVVSDGFALVSKVVGVPMACVGDFISIVRAARARRASQAAAERLSVASWRGETAQLAELWQREAGAIMALVVE